MTLRGLVVASGLLFGISGLVMALMVIISIVGGDYRMALQFAGMMTLQLAFAVSSRRYGSNDITPKVDTDAGGSTFRPDPIIEIPALFGTFGMAVYWASTLLARPQYTWLLVVAISLVTVGFAAFALPPYVQWSAYRYLRMTPEGVEIGQGLRSQSCGWDQVRDVTDTDPGRRSRTRPASVVVVSDDRVLTMQAWMFTMNGSALRDLVGFYWLHPEARGELTDGRVQSRLDETIEPLLSEWRGGA